ncbi:unnamed protein product [Triticum turgidum subsp. durum]|uniref:Uncharacterized protein n=1 Tax=Triticum turgidum subsp. durum TaxID=4567 RepID=A0A9R0Q3V0_TRITD|nr:unnamed protein product [Triticum turgidum subsp. durum]
MAMAALVVVLSLLILPTGEAQERRPVEAHPHGLPFESPLALSPAAYDFFHPTVRAGVVAGVFVGAAVVVLAALGLAYAVARRRVGVAQGDAEVASGPKSNA